MMAILGPLPGWMSAEANFTSIIMKTIAPSGFLSITKMLIVSVGFLLGAISTTQAREVSIYLTSQRFGNGETIHANSGDRKIKAAPAYTYALTGKIRGQTGKPIASLVKNGTDIAAFVEAIAPGKSSFLSGTFSNPGGKLPVTILNKTISGSRNVKGLGKVSVSFKMVGQILANGQCVLDITNVKIKTTPQANWGSIIFTKGATLSIETANIVTAD